jgi:hypothetical protein
MPTEKEELMSTKKEKRSTEHEKSTMPDIQKNNEQLDRSRYTLDLVNGWISSADSKIGTFGTVLAVVAAVFVYIADKIFSYVDTSVLTNPLLLTWSKIFAVLSSVTLVIAVLYCLLSLSPSLQFSFSCKVKNINHFSIFYEDIARMDSAEEYIRLAKESTEENFTDEVMRETYINSGICSKKMHRFRKGAIASVLSIIFYIGWILFYILAY